MDVVPRFVCEVDGDDRCARLFAFVQASVLDAEMCGSYVVCGFPTSYQKWRKSKDEKMLYVSWCGDD